MPVQPDCPAKRDIRCSGANRNKIPLPRGELPASQHRKHWSGPACALRSIGQGFLTAKINAGHFLGPTTTLRAGAYPRFTEETRKANQAPVALISRDRPRRKRHPGSGRWHRCSRKIRGSSQDRSQERPTASRLWTISRKATLELAPTDLGRISRQATAEE